MHFVVLDNCEILCCELLICIHQLVDLIWIRTAVETLMFLQKNK